ncbi:MAG: hypothetical protein MUC31_04520 [Bacteroidales bacterium]|nr:hypothetical protein [Bacteroidales bacterium]
MKEANFHDKRLRDLIRNVPAGSPGKEFTQKVMERIQQEPVPEEPLSRSILSRRTWWLLAAGLALVILLVFGMDWSLFDLNPENIDVKRYEKIIPLFQSMVKSFRSITGFFTQSSIPFILGIGIVSLLAIDRLVRKLTLRKSFLF